MSFSSITGDEDEEKLTLLNKRNLKNQSTFEEESVSSFKTKVDKHSKDIRAGLISSLLLIWACLMIPYDIYGSVLHGDTVWDIDMFVASLVMWLIAHICVIISSLLSLINLKYWKHVSWIPNAQLLLIMTATFLQITGSVLFSYSYCVNLTDSDSSTLWGTCVCKSHGLYILYNAGFIMYSGFIIFAGRFHGALPIFAFNFCNQYKAQSFTKNFRITYLSCVSFIGMILILVYGFDIYDNVDASYQAIYIGQTFILFGTFIVIIMQIIFHSHWICTNEQQTAGDYSASNKNISFTNLQTALQKKKKKRRDNCEYVLHLAVYFVMFAGILLTFLYSVVSKIPEASLAVERLRLVGNMLIMSGTALVICFEIYSKNDAYDNSDHIDHQYKVIGEEEKA